MPPDYLVMVIFVLKNSSRQLSDWSISACTPFKVRIKDTLLLLFLLELDKVLFR